MRKICFIILTISSILGILSCNSIVRKTTAKVGKSAAKEITENSSKELAEAVTKKSVKEVTGEMTEAAITKTGSRALREVATSNQSLRALYDNFTRRISKEFADGIVVTTTDKGVELVSKDFPNSFIRMNKNLMIGKGGSLKNSGPMNEFLNHLLPNKTYMIDDAFVYKTDDLGRVITCTADRSKAFKSIERNSQRNTDVQKYIVESLDGRVGLDDGGHLFANNTGGPNELINQIPMSRELNQHGQWRELERMEEKALKDGKDVFSQRNLLYRGNERRPYAIEFITMIDGKETRTVVENI